MNVALFPSAFHPSLGGVEELVRQLGLELTRRGDKVTVFTNRWPKSLSENETVDGLTVCRHVFRVPERSVRQLGGSILFGPGTLRSLCRQLRKTRCEVLHVQCVSSNAYYALWAKRLLGLPLIVTLQGELTMDAGELFKKSKFAQSLLRRALTAADIITGCSAKTLADAEAFYGKPFGSRARVIFNGASAADFNVCGPYPHPRPFIFAMGRLVPQKGFDTLIRAFAKEADLAAAGIDVIIAGDGPERNSLHQLVAEVGLSERIHLVGRMARNDVARLLTSCQFFVLPSRADEGLPVVCAEATAAGKAVIASCVGGVSEIIHDGETGLLVPSEDEVALAKAIHRLCVNPDLCRRLGSTARQSSTQFTWPVLAEQYSRAYQEVCRSDPIAAFPSSRNRQATGAIGSEFQ